MTREAFLAHCRAIYGTEPDFPFDGDWDTAVLRHGNSRKWYALVMQVSRRKFDQPREDPVPVVNLKLPAELQGSFGTADGVYPAYHMNKLHWVSVLLPDASDDVLCLLTAASYEATRTKRIKR